MAGGATAAIGILPHLGRAAAHGHRRRYHHIRSSARGPTGKTPASRQPRHKRAKGSYQPNTRSSAHGSTSSAVACPAGHAHLRRRRRRGRHSRSTKKRAVARARHQAASTDATDEGQRRLHARPSDGEREGRPDAARARAEQPVRGHEQPRGAWALRCAGAHGQLFGARGQEGPPSRPAHEQPRPDGGRTTLHCNRAETLGYRTCARSRCFSERPDCAIFFSAAPECTVSTTSSRRASDPAPTRSRLGPQRTDRTER